MSIVDIIWLFAGILLGMIILGAVSDFRNERTLSQVDQDMRKDLERYRNMSQSLLEDVKYWRDRYNTLRNVKEK